MSPAHNLVISLPHRFYTHNFVAIRKNKFGFSRESNQDFRGGSLMSSAPCHPCCIPNFAVDLFHYHSPGVTLDISPFQSLHKTFFSTHHGPIFTCIYPLGGQGRHIWQIVMKLPMTAGWWDASLTLWYLAMSRLRMFFKIEVVFVIIKCGRLWSFVGSLWSIAGSL